MLCNVPATIHNTDVIVVSYIQALSNTIHYNSGLHSQISYYTYDIQQGAVRMSQKNEINSAETTSRNSSSEESGDKKVFPSRFLRNTYSSATDRRLLFCYCFPITFLQN